MKRLLLIAYLCSIASSAWATFGYYSPVTVDHTKVPSTQTDFPVLVSVTDNRLRTVANGGHTTSASGFDIRPYSDSGLTTPLTYELERYNAATGEVVMWVKIASLSSSSDTVIYLGYCDASLTTDGSSTATWSNSFGRVYHLKDGITLSLTDSTGTTDLTYGSVSHPTAGTGEIDGGGSFASASSQYLVGDGYQQNAITYSIWVNATSLPAAYNYPVAKVDGPGTFFNLIGVKSTGKLRWMVSATAQIDKDGTGSHTLSTSTWYYLVLTYDSTNGLIGYVNAASDDTAAANGNCSNIAQSFQLSGLGTFNIQYWNGLLDEARLSSVARSANWITTEYNNQSAPGTFETLGTEVSSGACTTPTPTATATATATSTPTPTEISYGNVE